MKPTSHRIRFAIIFFAAFAWLITGSTFGSIDDTITKSFNVSPGGKLNLETDIGSIEVNVVEGNSVKVEVTRKVKTTSDKRAKRVLDEFELSFDQRGSDVYVIGEYERHGWRGFWNSIFSRLQVKFIVTVPRVYDVNLKTKGGSISVDDLEGEVYGRTSGGSITIGRVDGNVDVHTSGGSITIDRAAGDVDAHTSGGSIKVNEVMGAINARTSGGSVKATISQQPKSNCRLTTSGGSITVYMTENITADVNAKTSGGRVYTDFPVTIRGEISKRSLKAKINGGGPELYLRTSGGSIYIKEM